MPKREEEPEWINKEESLYSNYPNKIGEKKNSLYRERHDNETNCSGYDCESELRWTFPETYLERLLSKDAVRIDDITNLRDYHISPEFLERGKWIEITRNGVFLLVNNQRKGRYNVSVTDIVNYSQS